MADYVICIFVFNRVYECEVLASFDRVVPPAESQQKSPVVRPKDSAVHLSGKENVVSMEDLAAVQEELTYKDQSVYSYQQISCLDSVIRSEAAMETRAPNTWACLIIQGQPPRTVDCVHSSVSFVVVSHWVQFIAQVTLRLSKLCLIKAC